MTRIPDIKRYLQNVSIASDGLLVVKHDRPFFRTRDRIVVPRGVIDGLLTALHLRFSHPTVHQMKALASRYFYALDLDRSIKSVVEGCHHCTSLKCLQPVVQHQSTMAPPEEVGTSFAADVLRRYRQFILVVRETITGYTWCSFVAGEKHEELREAFLILSAEMRCLGEKGVVIRVDPAPAMTKLQKDRTLQEQNIKLEIGRIKNSNKNPVAEKAIQELGMEILNLSPQGGPISRVTLAHATANLNARIRRHGLSSRELWVQRDQVTGQQLPINDRDLIMEQVEARKKNHPYSVKSKSHGRSNSCPTASFQVGDLVVLKNEKDKTKARDRYIIASINDETHMCQLRKFTLSQFRSKTYDVHISDCYPIKPSTLCQIPLEAQRGVEVGYHGDQSEDEDEDLAVEQTPPNELVNQEEPPPLVQEVLMTPDPENPAPVVQAEVRDNITAADDNGLRRSKRVKKATSWLHTGDFVIE